MSRHMQQTQTRQHKKRLVRVKPVTETDVKDEVSEKEQMRTERDDAYTRSGSGRDAARSSTDDQAGAGISLSSVQAASAICADLDGEQLRPSHWETATHDDSDPEVDEELVNLLAI